MSYNKVILLGRLGQNPELKYTQAGTAVVGFSVATTEKWTDKSGEKKEITEWTKVVAWGKLAEICSQHLRKGSQALIEGKLTTRSFQDKSGVTKYVTEVQADQVRFVGGGKPQESEQSSSEPQHGDQYGF